MGNKINRYQPLGTIVFEKLKDSILKGELKAGQRLMESKIAKDLGVSRTPVREAIRKLEKENYVEMVPRKGAYVKKITKRDILEVLEIRVVLEGLAAKLAARRIKNKKESKDKLMENIKKFNLASETSNQKDLVKLDKEFHELIYSKTGNEKLTDMIGELQDQFQRFRLTYFKEFNNYFDIFLKHEELYKAIVSGDVKNAEKYAQQHIESIKENLERWISNNE